MKLTTKNIIALIFITLSFISLGFIFIASLNYNNYYWQARSAILDSTTNDTVVQSVRATGSPSAGGITIRIRVSATNPTGYQGLTLDQFKLAMFCFHSGNLSQSIFVPDNLLGSTSPQRPLGPSSTISNDVVFNLTATQSSQLQTFNGTYNGDIQANVVLTTRITSFFDSVFGGIEPIRTQMLPIQWS